MLRGSRRRVALWPLLAALAMPRVSLPHRIFQLGADDPALFGLPTSNAATDLRKAHALLESLHSGPCELGKTKILFKRMPAAGISHDLNSVVRAMAVAVRDQRQLVLLPPSAANRRKLLRLAGDLNERRPWHWLPDGVPLSSLLHFSSCQKKLRRLHPGALDALGNSTDATKSNCNVSQICGGALVKTRGLTKDNDVSNVWFVEIHPISIPKAFRRNGILWWFQVLTTFLVRINGPLARSIRTHNAMRPFLLPDVQRSGNQTRAGRLRAHARVAGLVWSSNASFDIGLHVRMGDACGDHADEHGLRMCLRSLPSNLERLAVRNVTEGTMFLASDSQRIVDQAYLARPAFETFSLRLQRTQYDVSGRIEDVLPRGYDLSSVRDALMELLLLSRARRVAGAMSSNMPRLALQLRVSPPGDRMPYIGLDTNEWCTCSSCKPYFFSGKGKGRGKERLIDVEKVKPGKASFEKVLQLRNRGEAGRTEMREAKRRNRTHGRPLRGRASAGL